MCAQRLILLPPCKRVGDADDAEILKQVLGEFLQGSAKLEAGGDKQNIRTLFTRRRRHFCQHDGVTRQCGDSKKID